MDKNAIKKYAVWARKELIMRVSQRAVTYGVSEDNVGNPNVDSVGGRLLSPTEKSQRQALIRKVKEDGYEQVMEEVAYTWFNRFAALRFMEVNGYLPSHVRVFTNDAGEFKPQILAEAIHLELDGLDRGKVYALEKANKTEELFKYLLIVQCNALNSILPGMFQRINDYTELLLPDYLLREGSVIERMVRQNTPDSIPEEDWTDQVQIIGWLYQYYISEKKDKVFADLKKNIKISKENIPAATQLFTPDWIVHYMVENSLGRLWLEGHPNDALKARWKYYLDEAEQEADVQAQLVEIRKEYASIKPEDVRVIDPCMGSGHILCVLFDVLVQIYEDYGYTAREAAVKIMENNLYGLDIDERAGQLAYFSVMMKARKYDRLFFRHPVQPHVYAIVESGHTGHDGEQIYNFSSETLKFFVNGSPEREAAINAVIEVLYNAKEYGSLLQLPPIDFKILNDRFDDCRPLVAGEPEAEAGDVLCGGLYYVFGANSVLQELLPLVQVAEVLSQKYDVVVTNPPYMVVSNADSAVQKYVKDNYPDSKADLFAVFIEQCGRLTKANCYQAMITQHAWMFLSSFEKLRMKLQAADTVNMAHLGARAFEEIGGEVVQTTSFVLRRSHVKDYAGTYCRLVEPTTQQGKEDMFLMGEHQYIARQVNFLKIPGNPIAYWASNNALSKFGGPSAADFYTSRVGLMTTDNERFLRYFWEVDFNRICYSAIDRSSCAESGMKWFPHNKGGAYRKWYGNRDYVVDWENNGERIKETAIQKYPYLNGNPNFVVHDDGFYFRENISWSEIAMANTTFRYFDTGFTFNVKGMSAFKKGQYSLYDLIALANSCVFTYYARIVNPSISFGVNSFSSIPFIYGGQKASELAKSNISISRADWDSFETSWDFQQHPLVRLAPFSTEEMRKDVLHNASIVHINRVQDAFELWSSECSLRFKKLKANEEELNRIFIDIYGLQDELTPEVEDKDVTVRLADLGRDVRSLISYAVGCMFGRYSLDKPGLVYAGGDWDSAYKVEKGSLTDEDGNAIIFGDIRISIAPPPQINYDGVWKNLSFAPDADNIIPICDDDYFEDDIVGRFIQWLEIAYGKESLEDNLEFIAGALGGKGTPREVLRSYFLNDFYADHLKIYQKRPIYWLFDSGKKNGFKCLIYMHRYQPDTIARIRTDYVHEQQSRYRTAITDLERRVNDASPSERVKLTKKLQKLQDQAEEVRIYEEKIHHLADQMIKIDLDDGVKHNYALFQDVLAKIK